MKIITREQAIAELREIIGKDLRQMAITMINADDVSEKDFENSHLFYKLKSLIICSRLFKGKDERH